MSRFPYSIPIGYVLACALVAGFAGVAQAAPLPPGKIRVVLPDSVEVTGAQVSLGDVAALAGEDLAIVRRLDALPLGPAPGEAARVLDREVLARWIRTRAGIGSDRIVWLGATKTEIRSVPAVLASDAVVRAASRAMEEWLGRFGSRVELQATGIPRDTAVPVGRLSLRPRPINEASPRKRMLVWVDAYVDDRYVRTVSVAFDVGVYASLPTLALDLPAGAPLRAEDIAIAEVDATRVAGSGARIASGEQRRLRRPMRAGDPLLDRHLEAMPVVGRGETAIVRLSAGTVALEGRVEVLQDGYPGQLVRVRSTGGSAGTVLARVVGPGQVEIAQ